MRIALFNLLCSILYSIYRAEDAFKEGEGGAKLAQVIKETHLKGYKLRYLSSAKSRFSPKILEAIIDVIEAVVVLLNLLGVFQRAGKK